jgi:perosamine synthetase
VKQETRAVPLSGPYLDEREEELVLEVLRSGRLSLGPTIDRFEELFAEAVGAPYAAAVSSGTAGLHLLCRIAGVGPGDEVITSPYSFAASANCFLYERAEPVFADVDARTYNLDPDAVAAAITPRTKAIVAVDIFGYPCELDPLRALCEEHGLALVQDACEALGAEYRGRRVGSHGTSAVFAFYPNKQITTGEGGMVTTDDEATWRALKSLSNQGRAEGDDWLKHDRLGYNYRLDDVSAAIGLGQLERLDELLGARAAVAARYDALLAGVEGVTPPAVVEGDERSWFVYVVLLDEGCDRDGVMARLREEGIGCRAYLPPIHLQPFFRERGHREGELPVCEGISRRCLALPFFTRLEPGDQERVVHALRRAVEAAWRS